MKVCPGWAVLGGGGHCRAGQSRDTSHFMLMDKFWHFAQWCEDLMAQGHFGAGSSLVFNARTECLTPPCRVRLTGWRRASHRGAGGEASGWSAPRPLPLELFGSLLGI